MFKRKLFIGLIILASTKVLCAATLISDPDQNCDLETHNGVVISVKHCSKGDLLEIQASQISNYCDLQEVST